MTPPRTSGYGPAVVDGKVLYTSPSALNTLDACPRKWWFKYVARLPDDPQTPAMQFGTGGHKRIELYLTTGEDLLGPVERAGIEYIPLPGDSLLVEKKTSEDIPLMLGPIPVKGSMDLAEFLLPTRPPNDMGPTAWGHCDMRVTDWKFTSKLANKNTTPESLLDPTDPEGRQMIMYAEWLRLNSARILAMPDLIELRHVHFQMGRVSADLIPTGPFKAREIISPRVRPAVIAAAYQNVVDTFVDRLQAAARAKRPEDVKAEAGFCYAYHKPCAYLSKCPTAGRETDLSALFKSTAVAEPIRQEPKVSMLDQLKNLHTKPAPPSAKAVVASMQAESDSIFAEANKALAARVPNSEKPVETPEMQAYLDKVLAGPVPPKEAVKALSLEECAALVGPAVAPTPKRDISKAPPAAMPAPAPAVEFVAEPKPKRGRPTKQESAAREAARLAEEAKKNKEPDFAALGPDIVLYTPEAPSEPVTAPAAATTFKLYFSCHPTGVVANTLHEYMLTLERRILTALGVESADIRMADKHPALGFGKWKAAMGQMAKENPPGLNGDGGHFVVYPGDERIEAVAAGLESIALPGDVVRGGR